MTCKKDDICTTMHRECYKAQLRLLTLERADFISMPYEPSSWIPLVQKCTSLRKARQLHALIILTSPPFIPSNPFLNNNLVTLYSKCGSLEDSHKVFDQMPQRNLVSFNSLISAYSRNPHYAFCAFQLLSYMLYEGLRPNNKTFSSLVQAASSLEDMLMGLALHSQVVKFGFSSDLCTQTSLLGMYSNCGNLECSKRVFDDMADRDAIAWNSVIFGSLKNGKIMQALRLFSAMVRTGIIPTQFTYTMMLNACSRLRDYIRGRIIHGHIIKSNQPLDMPLQNALVDMYSTCGDTETAFYVFRNIESPDIVSWNSIIAGYFENGDGEKAMYMFTQLCKIASERPDEYTFATIISAIGELPASDYGRPLHAHVEKAGLASSIFVGSTLISMYLKNGETDSAQEIFNSMTNKDPIMWTEMISGHSRLGDSENALKYFYKMQEEGHNVDNFSISSVLSSCADLATLKQGEMIHAQAVKTGYDDDTCVCGSLVDMYAKTGNLPAAQELFSTVSDPDLKCWNSLLGGYSNHGQSEEAVKFFDEILKQGLRPDQVTFISLLSACSHGGLVEEGKLLWDCMKREGIQPGLKHYSCMVSLLSRAGLLQEAEDLIEEAPYGKDFLELWRILLSSCVVFRKLERGVCAAEEVLRVDCEDSATLIMLSNLYAAFGKWDAVSDTRKKIRAMSLEKDPGLSWIELPQNIQVFSSNDQCHPHFDDSRDELQRLRMNMIKSDIQEFLDTVRNQ